MSEVKKNLASGDTWDDLQNGITYTGYCDGAKQMAVQAAVLIGAFGLAASY